MVSNGEKTLRKLYTGLWIQWQKILEVDVKYPKELLNLHGDLQFLTKITQNSEQNPRMTLEGILQVDEQFTVWKECGECNEGKRHQTCTTDRRLNCVRTKLLHNKIVLRKVTSNRNEKKPK